jgi:hypothetical protein
MRIPDHADIRISASLERRLHAAGPDEWHLEALADGLDRHRRHAATVPPDRAPTTNVLLRFPDGAQEEIVIATWWFGPADDPPRLVTLIGLANDLAQWPEERIPGPLSRPR